MTRPLRVEYPGAIYHVTARGNDGQEIFSDHYDHLDFLERMSQAVERFCWRYYAYCLMTNHYHLVVQTPQANLSRGMAWLNGGYAQSFNRLHNATGHVFQSRFKALLVQRETYLLAVLRYTVLNPVRAGMCAKPNDYQYSSFRETFGGRPGTSLVDQERVLSLFDRDVPGAKAAYHDFVHQGIGAQSIHEKVRAKVFLGDERFVSQHTINLPDEQLPEVSSAARPDPKPALSQLIEDAADIEGLYCAYREWGYTMRQIGRQIRKHHSTVSRLIKGHEA